MSNLEEPQTMDVVMELIVHSGNAKSIGMEALDASKQGDFLLARQKLEEADQELLVAHQAQTSLLKQEASGQTIFVSLLMVHGQDHLMNAITFLDLARELVEVYQNMKPAAKG
ncbi:PTS lactose/cellobiose transporter subunit IIA [Heyndrickxia coagulans]|uniref:PTS lactose/cellobiose transporter subunit IIA n=1 Tax=Heyndrickxia coagulans TaxID=1398 RepID=UPI00399C92A4